MGGASVLMGEFSKKIIVWGDTPSHAPPHYGKPCSVYYRQCVVFVNHIETNPHNRIVLECISLNSGLWSNLLRKPEIITTFHFPTEDESAQ